MTASELLANQRHTMWWLTGNHVLQKQPDGKTVLTGWFCHDVTSPDNIE